MDENKQVSLQAFICGWYEKLCLKLTLQLYNFAKDECLNRILLSKHFIKASNSLHVFGVFKQFFHLVVASIIISNISRVQFNFSKMIGEIYKRK